MWHVTFYHDHWTRFCMRFPKIYNTTGIWEDCLELLFVTCNIWHIVVFCKIVCNLRFVTCNMCDMLHVKQVTCKIFIITIELYFAWAFQKYMTHGVFSKIVCNLIFVTCNMCDILHVTNVTCDILSWPLN